jgi:penicillin amidase
VTQPVRMAIGAAWRLALLWLWIGLLGHKLGPVPPPGKFFSPFQGFWRNAEIRSPKGHDVSASGLLNSVSLKYDHRGVPHVFSDDLQGMFFAQGYATARDRLWQMDIQSRAGLGRLSEVMGSDLLRFDLSRRRLGMASSAQADLEEMQKDSLTNVALMAYAAGVNAWIATLKRADYPLEFKLLDYAPEPWTPLKSVALLKNLQWTLSKGTDDVALTRTLEKFGSEFFSELFPLRNPGAEPILPSEIFSVRAPFDTATSGPLSVRADSDPPLRTTNDYSASHPPPGAGGISPFPPPQPGSGSDNFAIAGTRTASGHPILGNDPHLDLSLPSIWYEVQLQGGAINGYGVSVPGLPGIVIGFNSHAAWGVTNGMDDVFDVYKLRFQNDSLTHYWWNGRWRETKFVLDTISMRGGKTVIDTQLWTHLGPVPVKSGEQSLDANVPALHAVQWIALQPSNEIGAFLRMLSAKDYGDFRTAIRSLHCPSQNFVFIDSGDIALTHQGRIPVKRFGQGRTVLRENDSDFDWSTYIPDSLLPSAYNPARGWLSSANQEVTDSSYPYYLGSGFYPSERAGRLHRLMEATNGADISSAWEVMLNNQSLRAEQSLPLLLGCMDSVSMSPNAQEAVKLLRHWDGRYHATEAEPALFDLWWKRFYTKVWDDDFEGDTLHYAWPSHPVTRALLASNPNSDWFDDIRTPRREKACDLVRGALEEAVQSSLQTGNGSFTAWNQVHPLSIPHLLRLAPLGTGKLSGDGCAECLNAQRGSHGPSWRMAVELGKTPVASGGYPGGQSGNPGSPDYDAFVTNWLTGKPYRLLFLMRPDEQPDSIAYTLTLKGSK